MAEEEKTKPRLEIAHVLFIDIVDYSKLRINQQSEILRQLNAIVSGTSEFREAESEGKLIRLPTGDGMALVFRTTPEAPAQCALEISRALENHPNIHLRMGVHSGPVNEITDVNQRANIAGAGINIAQRVMDCGDAGHILLSKRVADDLEQFDRWRPLLHDLGICEVKHGVRVGVVSLYAEGAGNPQLPKKLEVFRKHRLRMRWIATLTALLLLAAIVGGLILASKKRKSSIGSIPEKSIAVLPFENLSGDPENAYFADGIQEEILTRLSKIADLKVISRTSTQRYKSAPDNLTEIAKQLGVAHILEGTVQKAADQVRVNVQLINAENDSHVWADKFDRKLTDIFAVESEIATKIAETLQAKLTGAEQRAISSRPTDNPEAHQFYLKGRYYWNKRYEEGLTKAIEYFKQAIGADPNYAPAYAGLADSYALLGFHGYGVLPPTEAMPKAKAAAEKALQIDEALGEAHASLAYVTDGYDWDLAGAEKEYKRAIELNPNYATAHQFYGVHLAVTGRHQEAMAEIKQAQQLDPLSLIINVNVAWIFYFARQYDQAVVQCEKTLELDPNFAGTHWMRGQAYRQKGIYEKAIAEFQKAASLSKSDAVLIAVLGHAYAVAGKRGEAQKVINELKELSKRRYFPAYFIALIYVGLDDKDQAFEWLEKAFAERSELTFLKAEPMFDPIRSDARFQDLVRRVEAKGNLP
jgi:TolB-like protein/Flp pilus assembly protein TadD/class 3 adenylate cyclase